LLAAGDTKMLLARIEQSRHWHASIGVSADMLRPTR
jgi:hypothetical protein